MKSIRFAVVVLAVLIVLGGLMVLTLVRSGEPQVSKVVAKRDLPAFTLLRNDDLQVTPIVPPGQTSPNIDNFTSRYLLVSAKTGVEIKHEMVADPETTLWLANAVAVSIPASLSTTLGGQLHAGDWVALIAVPPKEGAEVKKFEKLMVLTVVLGSKDVPPSNSITLALPGHQRDEFASAVAGAQLLVSRKIGAN
jgi:Flp pilus assembly protein CpaB